MKKILAYMVLFLLIFPHIAWAHIRFVSVYPSPKEGENEYMEIQNTGCDDISLEWYEISDLSNKRFVLSAEILASGEVRKILDTESKIQLNNDGDSLMLKNPDGEVVDLVTYKKTAQGKLVIFSVHSDECDEADTGENPEEWEGDEENPDNENDSSWGQDDENEGSDEGMLEPDSLAYTDSDGDGFIDRLIISYSETLTGSVLVESIYLASASGWLYNDAVSFMTGMIVFGGLQDQEMWLDIMPATHELTHLIITADDDSHLRLFSEEDFGVSTLSGRSLAPFSEHSFSGYMNILHPDVPEDENTDNDDGNSGSGVTHGSGSTAAMFPLVIPELQKATDAILEENTLYCAKNPCRINLNFDAIFSEQFPKSAYSCTVLMKHQSYRGCNPPQESFTGAESVSLILKRNADDTELVTTFLLDMSRVLPPSTSNNSNTPRNYRYTYSTPPVINIASEGKWQSHYEWSDDEVISCFSSSCAVNLTASGTFSFENMPLKYVWTFGKYGQKTQKNPSTVTFETGKHTITLFVSDSNGMSSTKEITVLVPEVSASEAVSKNTKNAIKKSEKSAKSPETLEDVPWEFSPPELILQNPERWRKENDRYVCMTDATLCSANFSLSWAQKEVIFVWRWNDEEEIMAKNPKSKALSPWEHRLMIRAFHTDDREAVLWEKLVTLQVNRLQKAKTPKNTSKKVTSTKGSKKSESKKQTSKKSQGMVVPSEEKSYIRVETEPQNAEEYMTPLSLAGMALASGIFLVFRRRTEDEFFSEK